MAVVFPGKTSGQLVCQGRLKDIMYESQGRGRLFQSSQVGGKMSLKVMETKEIMQVSFRSPTESRWWAGEKVLRWY